MKTAKCPKPGCGAMRLIGRPCMDWDCPQGEMTVREAIAEGFSIVEAGRDPVKEANPLELVVAFVARMCWRSDPPNANNSFTERERFSAIKHHPTIKHYGLGHIRLADAEAALSRSTRKGKTE